MAVQSGGQRVELSGEKMDELLRPELEAGSISWQDFERTKRFASVNRNYWPSATGTITAASIIYYGHWYRRPRWSKLSLLLIVPIAYAVGTLPGAVAQILAVKKFQRGLEDPKGVLDALGRRVRLEHATTSSKPSSEQAQDPFSPSPPSPPNPPQSNDQEDDLQSRWAELRKASATASTSTWDSIRQSHERSGTNQGPQTGGDSGEQDDRQTEQTKFDALLEAERKMSS